MLYCPNYSCQTPNPETHKFCQKCRTTLPKHYLWAIGEQVAATKPGELVQSRFLCKVPGVFLDTKPGLIGEPAIEVPPAFTSYLRLSPYQLHIPQVYEVLDAKTVMLDEAAVVVMANGEVQVLPALKEVWPQASALRQLSWLWQIASLWQPLSIEQSAASLLQNQLLRAEGGIVRLLELVPPQEIAPTLVQLGEHWALWTQTADPAIADFFDRLCHQLIAGEIRQAEQLVGLLDQAMEAIAQGQQVQIHIATRTDQGPTRQRNEDACFPDSGTVKTFTISANQTAADPALAIVCDGIGGHQGGDVASHLAIDTLGEQLQGIHAEQLNPAELTAALEAAVWAANDRISQRNDSEQRFDRQRMGTTLVMGLVRDHELYTTHVGDSRAYRITRWGCRQVTLDDDIASREVRLGYSAYREALQNPGSGSLIQALGMGASHSLHPTVQRFVLDEDCVFLLCSDGLSDNDRVHEIWDSEILPLLNGGNLSRVCDRLVELANTRNGHDNVTVALLHCQVSDRGAVPPLNLPAPVPVTLESPTATIPVAPKAAIAPVAAAPPPTAPSSTLKTQIIKPAPSKPRLLPLLLSIAILLGIGGGLAALLFPSLFNRRIASNPSSPAPTTSPTVNASPVPPLQVNAFLAIAPNANSLPLLAEPNTAGAAEAVRQLPAGTILQVLKRQSSNQQRWVQIRVCTLPDAPVAETPATAIDKLNVKPGDTGWLAEATAAPLVAPSAAIEQGACTPAASPPPNPSPASTPAGNQID